MPHWRMLMDQEYLHEYHLEGKELRCTIERVAGAELTGTGGKKNRKPVLFLKGLPEGLPTKYATCTTVCKVIATARGDDYTKWAGLDVILYPAITSMIGGGDGPCIRVKLPKEPKQ